MIARSILLVKYYSGDKIKGDEMGRTCGTNGEENCIEGFGWVTKGKKSLQRHRHKLEDNIKMDLKNIGWKNAEWIHQAQYKEKWQAVLNIQVT